VIPNVHIGGGRLDWDAIAEEQEARALAKEGPSSVSSDNWTGRVDAPRALLGRLLALTSEERRAAVAELSKEERQALALVVKYDWRLWARDKQLPPSGNWRWWIILAGRMFGKTRTGAEWIRACAESGKYRWLTIVGPTREAVRKIMLNGPAGLLKISPPWFAPMWSPSNLTVTWPIHPVTGVQCQARIYSAERPERMRGEQHEIAWLDEVGAWPRPEAFHQIAMGLRLAVEGGKPAQALITTTPRSTPLILDLVLGPKVEGKRVPKENVVVTRGISEENAGNVDPEALKDLRATYGLSALGRQELDAELFERSGTELWTDELIASTRVKGMPCEAKRMVVAVDPTRAESPTDECGIVVGALGEDGHAYVLDDLSLTASPQKWTEAALRAVRERRAEHIVYEQNRLGKTAENTIRAADTRVPWVAVTASRGKFTRAEPVAALYEQGRVHHVGQFLLLEDEMVRWDPNAGQPSPNRMDALVWLITDLLLQDSPMIVAPRSVGGGGSRWRSSDGRT
jgi:phage terminase large subunit-like protein